jgi:hypothetical protein
MSIKVVLGIGAAVGAFMGVSALTSDGAVGCKPDGDGGATILRSDGTQGHVRSIEITPDGKTCVLDARSGTFAPVVR